MKLQRMRASAYEGWDHKIALKGSQPLLITVWILRLTNSYQERQVTPAHSPLSNTTSINDFLFSCLLILFESRALWRLWRLL